MAGEDKWFSSPGFGGGEVSNGGFSGYPNIPFSGFSLPVSGLQSSGSGFSSSFSLETNSFCTFFDPSNSSSSVSGPANQEVGLKRIKLADSNYQSTGHNPFFQEGEGSMAETPKPLGLTLRKSNSFVNLVDEKISKNIRISPNPNQRTDQLTPRRIQPKTDNSVPSPSPEKFKATNFPFLILQIGSWVYESQHEGQLVAKCYYSKKKLVWEILDGSLKKKMEIQWSDISAIGVDCIDNDPVVLKIELKNPPEFHGETNPQPRKHTIWQKTNDFTGGQASSNRRHWLKFPPGVLGKQYEKLLQCDRQLYILSTQPFPTSSSSFFFPPTNGNASTSNWDSTSPISVMEFSSIDETGHKHGAEKRRKRGLTMVTGNAVRGFVSGKGEIQRIPYLVPAIQANQDLGLQGYYYDQMPNLPPQNMAENVNRAEKPVRPPPEYNDQRHFLGNDIRTEIGMTDERFLPTLEQQQQQQHQQFLSGTIPTQQFPAVPENRQQQASEPLPTPQLLSRTMNTGFGQELLQMQQLPAVPENQQQQASEPLPTSQFLSGTMNTGFGQDLLRTQQFPAVPENQQQQHNFQTANWEPQRMQFEGNNNLIDSHFMNDDVLIRDNGNSSGSSYPNIFPDTIGEDFGNRNWGYQYG